MIFLLAIFPLLVTRGSFPTVEIQFRLHNEPIIPNILVPGLELSSAIPLSAPITFGHEAYMRVAEWDRYTILTPYYTDNGIYAVNNFVLSPWRTFRTNWLVHNRNTRVVIGIGPCSELVGLYQSISVIRNNADNYGALIFGDTQRVVFNQSCEPSTFARIPYLGILDRPNTLVQIRFGLRAANSSDYEDFSPSCRNNTASLDTSDDSQIVSLPRQMYEVIIMLIIDAGASMESQSLITGCNRESLIALLPDIVLTFPQSGAIILLYPEDYIRFNIERNECSLNLGPIGSFGMVLNPFLIPGLNIHITRTELLICDSS
jgi:hypothetical protein